MVLPNNLETGDVTLLELKITSKDMIPKPTYSSFLYLFDEDTLSLAVAITFLVSTETRSMHYTSQDVHGIQVTEHMFI